MTFLRASLCAVLFAGLLATPSGAGAENASSVGVVGAPGVTAKRIKIGMHGPVTGAAPLPTESVQRGADLYFRWLERRGVKINGRYVDVAFKNDNYNPTQAVAGCKEMVEQDSVFLLVGLFGANQIQACARYAASESVPYVSWGTTELGLKPLPRYFATSMSDEQQADLAADLLVAKHRAKSQQNAVIWTNTPTDKAARDRFVAAMEKRGAEVHMDRPVPKTAGASEAQAVAAEMEVAGIDNAFYLGRPTFWVQVEQASANLGENVQWASVDQTFGTDGLVGVMCRQRGDLKAAMLSPVPAFTDRDRFDPRHDKAMAAIYGEPGDHTTWRGWALGRNLAEMLRESPRSLTRKAFVRKVGSSTIETGITPKLPYARSAPFAARKTHLLRADCATDRWKTTKTFVSKF